MERHRHRQWPSFPWSTALIFFRWQVRADLHYGLEQDPRKKTPRQLRLSVAIHPWIKRTESFGGGLKFQNLKTFTNGHSYVSSSHHCDHRTVPDRNTETDEKEQVKIKLVEEMNGAKGTLEFTFDNLDERFDASAYWVHVCFLIHCFGRLNCTPQF